MKRPIRKHYNWDESKLGHCDSCDKWERLIDDTCACCHDAAESSNWQHYADYLEKAVKELVPALDSAITCANAYDCSGDADLGSEALIAQKYSKVGE